MIKKHLSSIRLGTALLIISIVSLFIGVMDIDLKALLSGGNGMELNIFLLSRIPRLLAILCTGVGMRVARLIMQQLCIAGLNDKKGGCLQDNIRLAGDCKAIEVSILHGNPLFKEAFV